MAANEIDQAIRDKRVYFVGERLPSDWYEAFRLWLPLAESGDAKAQFNIGRCYSTGDGVDEDPSKSVEWLMKAADQGDPRAHYNLYLRYEEMKDEKKAAEWLTKATELGEPRALVLSGKKALGSGNKDKARILFKRALDSGSGSAALGLAACDLELTNLANNSSQFSFRVINNSSIPVFFVIKARPCNPENPEEIWGDDLVSCYQYALVEPGLQLTGRYENKGNSVAIQGFTLGLADADKDVIKSTLEYFPFERNIGLKKSGCFILTACYGDYDAPTVMQYRHFRDNYLDTNVYGKKFISWYYTYGPKWAEMIEKMPRTKAILRVIFNQLAKLLPR